MIDGAGGNQVGTSGSPIDPRLGTLANSRGPTFTHALQRGSPAVNQGTCTDAPTTDQRGWARPDVRHRLCDAGAYELGIPTFLPAVRKE